MSELDVLDPVPETVTLSTGTVVVVEDLRARQVFKLLRIITRGALGGLADLSMFKVSGDDEAAEFTSRLVSLMLLSIPEAENEAIDFLQSMVKPYGLIERRGVKLSKADTERNTELWARVLTELDNPRLEDLVTLIETIVQREAKDILALGKRLAALLKMADKTGQLKPRNSPDSPTSPELSFSVDSAAHSTNSATTTGGATSTSETFHFAGSDNV